MEPVTGADEWSRQMERTDGADEWSRQMERMIPGKGRTIKGII